MTSWKFNFLLFTIGSLVSLTLQSKVEETCPANTDDSEQCYTVSFVRSVFEGHSGAVAANDSKSIFSLTIFSSTPRTSLLRGYNISFEFECRNASAFEISQLAETEPTCEAVVTGCSNSGSVVTVEANADTVKDNTFLAVVKFPISSGTDKKFSIKPVFEGDTDSVYSSPIDSGFTSSDVDTTRTSGKSSPCSLEVSLPTIPPPEDPGLSMEVIGAVAAAIVFAVLLLGAALVAKVYSYWDKIRGGKSSSVGATHMELNQSPPEDAEAGTYTKQPML